MRVLVRVTFPHEPFNAAVRDGTIGDVMNRILEASKPETVYFLEEGGRRCAHMVVNLDDPSGIPALAEPWFLKFQADCRFDVVMVPDDLRRSGLEELGKRWG